MSAKIYCVCNEASAESCTNDSCLKYKQLQPFRCLNYDGWKRTDDTRPVIFTFTKPE